MEVFSYSVLGLGLVMLFYIIHLFFFTKNKMPAALFSEALQQENTGQYEIALLQYEKVLLHISRSINPNLRLISRITEKIKVLKSVVDYSTNFRQRKRAAKVTAQ